MAQFEILGLCDCPFFAKAVKLSEKISEANPRVEFHYEMHDRFHWPDVCEKMKRQRGWDIKRSPVVYQVVVDPNGKAILIGDCNDFCEFAAMYFDIYYDPPTSLLEDLAHANAAKYVTGQEEEEGSEDNAVLNVAIIDAPFKLLEHLLARLLATVEMIPPGVKLNIRIHDEETESGVLNGLLMETIDMCSPRLSKISIASTLNVCMYRSNLIIIAEDFSRRVEEDEGLWINRVEMKVVEVIAAINDKKANVIDCRIVVGGAGPSCYVAEMLRKSIPLETAGPGRIVASTQFISQKVKAKLGEVANISGSSIGGIHLWGWPGETGVHVEVEGAFVKSGHYYTPEEVAKKGDLSLRYVADEAAYGYILEGFAEDFLFEQKEILNHVKPQPQQFMALADSIANTVHLWLYSERLMLSPPAIILEEIKAELALRGGNGKRKSRPLLVPVINVGVLCEPNPPCFPDGVYMAQPSVCIEGKWYPLGFFVTRSYQKVMVQLMNLLTERQRIIFRDENVKHFPDLEELMNKTQEYPGMDKLEEVVYKPLLKKKKSKAPGLREGSYNEEGGEGEGDEPILFTYDDGSPRHSVRPSDISIRSQYADAFLGKGMEPTATRHASFDEQYSTFWSNKALAMQNGEGETEEFQVPPEAEAVPSTLEEFDKAIPPEAYSAFSHDEEELLPKLHKRDPHGEPDEAAHVEPYYDEVPASAVQGENGAVFFPPDPEFT